METARKRYTFGYKNDVARLHIKNPQSTISIPAFVCRQWFDKLYVLGLFTDIITLSVDESEIKISPASISSDETFVLCTNGSGAGRKVTLPLYLVDKYDLKAGYYHISVLDDGALQINLKERVG